MILWQQNIYLFLLIFVLSLRLQNLFNHLKNALYLEAFVGIKENSIKQEFYSILIKYNIIMLFTEEAKIMEMNNKKNFKVGI